MLQGIWATAPYLHNGSVPTLAELLKARGPTRQAVQDRPCLRTPVNVASRSISLNSTTPSITTDCSDLSSGNSNCGHEFGTQLTDPEKKALLEYLKTL